MANPEHLEILKQGVEVWNKWREENPDFEPDLAGIKYSRTDWKGIDLSRAVLRDAELSETQLGMSDLTEADLTDANLEGAALKQADLSGSILKDCSFDKALLKAASFSGIIFTRRSNFIVRRDVNFFNTGVRFTGAMMEGTIFRSFNFSEIKGLESVIHRGPSSVDIDTIYRSKGKIPEAFLRGCGVPENFIQYMSSLTGRAFEYYSCFISYSSKNQDFAERLHADLQTKGVRCWFAPEEMKIGDKIRDRIDQSIRIHDKLLLILSEHSINSEWVEDEVEAAYEQERDRGKTVLFPIRLDPAVMDTDKAWASKLRRQRHIGDFTRWKDHNAYQKAFDRLMRDLKADKPIGNY